MSAQGQSTINDHPAFVDFSTLSGFAGAEPTVQISLKTPLTRKAAEIKQCAETALEQAEESKQRAVELAKREKDKEIMELKAQLREARAYGVDADGSLKKALVLVESNQRAVNKVAQKDKHVIKV